MDKNELYHHGVLGMKWGVRRTPAQLGTGRKQKKQRADNLAKARKTKAERKEALAKGRIKPSKMTDAELKKEISRMQLEKSYIELKSQTGRNNTGKNFVKKYAGEAVNKILWNGAVDLAAQSAKAIGADRINKVFNKYGFDGDVVYANNKRKS